MIKRSDESNTAHKLDVYKSATTLPLNAPQPTAMPGQADEMQGYKCAAHCCRRSGSTHCCCSHSQHFASWSVTGERLYERLSTTSQILANAMPRERC